MTKDEALNHALQLVSNLRTHSWTVADTQFVITAIKEALANEALEKKAENARELGLNYEPDWTTERIAGMARLKEAQDKKLAQPEQKPMHPQLKAMLEEYFDKCFTESAPQRTWVGLTDEEIQTEWVLTPQNDKAEGIWFGRRIEAKLRSKND